jgi:Zn-dependent alcohol dehydrogenase
MTITTRAAVLHAFDEPQQVQEVELRAPASHEVLVRVTAAGVCHSDVGQADGEWDHPLPVVLGHEGAGVIERVGEGVSGWHPGQRVLLSLAPGCGHCRHCMVGRPILCQASLAAMGEGRLTTGPTPITGGHGPISAYSLLACFAEHTVVAARSLIALPDDVSDTVGALIGCAVITGAGAAIATVDIEAGSRGAVIGAGGVGVNAIMGARARGATTVDAFDPSGERAETARRFGATGTIDPGDGDLVESLKAAAPDRGYDWTLVTVGSPAAMELAVELLRPGGVAVMVGLTPQDHPVPIDMLSLVTYERRIVGSAYGTQAPAVLMPRIIELYRRGALKLDELAGHRFPLDGVNEAFDTARNVRGLRTVLEMPPSSFPSPP